MNISRNRMLPPDLKSCSSTPWKEDLIESLRTIAAAILMAVMLLIIIYAGNSSDSVDYPVDREVMRR